MSASKLYCYPKTLRRLYEGPLGTYIDGVAARYIEQGYPRYYATGAFASVVPACASGAEGGRVGANHATPGQASTVPARRSTAAVLERAVSRQIYAE